MSQLSVVEKIGNIQGHHEILIREAGGYEEKEVLCMEAGVVVRKRMYVPTGHVVKRVVGHNLVVNRFKTQLAHLCVGDDTSVRYINRMAWGTGGHVGGDPSSSIAPLVTDTQLETSVITKPIASVEFPSPSSVMIVAFLVEAEANGYTITESGLMAGDNTLVARRTFAGLAKTNEFVFEFKHTLLF